MHLVFKFPPFGGFLFERRTELVKWLNNSIYSLLTHGSYRQKEKYFIGFNWKTEKIDIYIFISYNFNNYSQNSHEHDWKKKLSKKEFQQRPLWTNYSNTARQHRNSVRVCRNTGSAFFPLSTVWPSSNLSQWGCVKLWETKIDRVTQSSTTRGMAIQRQQAVLSNPGQVYILIPCLHINACNLN